MNDLAFTRSRLIELYQRDNGWFPIHPNANNNVSFEFEIRFHLYCPISHASVINLDRWYRITALVYESIDRCLLTSQTFRLTAVVKRQKSRDENKISSEIVGRIYPTILFAYNVIFVFPSNDRIPQI